MRRSATVVHGQMRQGLSSLATIVCLAPFVGIFGTLIGIVDSFRGISGDKIVNMAATFAGLSEACVPTALGLLVAIPSLWFYKYLVGKLECFDREMENASLELVNLLPLRLPRLASAAAVNFVAAGPIFRDELGDELGDDRRPWYRSSLMVAALLIVTWCVQFARYFENDELLLQSIIWRVGAHVVILTFAIFWFAAYPVWLKLLHRASGGLASLASLLCLGWSLTELFFHVYLW
jgi:hypothetical protein